MKLPYLLLNRIDQPKMTLTKGTRALARQVQEARFREMLEQEAAAMECLRNVMR